jgi:hypothetical protein
MQLRCWLVVAAALPLAACGPNARSDDDGDDGDDGDDSSCEPVTPTETACGDLEDEDCDGASDCADPDCFGIDGCPLTPGNCEVATPSASLSLPDGVCTGIPPFMGTDPENQAFLMTCSAYEATMNLSGFPAGARLTNTSQLVGVCVKMEHSWLRDLQIEAHCPDGARVILSRFQGQDCPNPLAACEVYLGQANDLDDDQNPVPGVGMDYCWKTSATNPSMLDFANQDGSPMILPAGDYQPSEPFTNFMNCSLNGAWRIRVVDGWGIDNGYIFESRLVFDGTLSDECPVIE